MKRRTETSDRELIALVEIARIFKPLSFNQIRRILLYVLKREGLSMQYEKNAIWLNLKGD